MLLISLAFKSYLCGVYSLKTLTGSYCNARMYIPPVKCWSSMRSVPVGSYACLALSWI